MFLKKVFVYCALLSCLFVQNCCFDDVIVKGIYTGVCRDVDAICKVAKKVGANAVVVDIKDDFGNVLCDLSSNTVSSQATNIKEFLRKLKLNGLIPIARIVVFKDPLMAKKHPELAVQNSDGTVWMDKEKTIWLDPYNQKVWDYILQISKQAVEAGFMEIQYDYIRFSSYKCDFYKNAKYTKSRPEIITQGLKYLCNSLHAMNVKVSADVFGCIIEGAVDVDAKKSTDILGQDYIEIAKVVDYICPMIYPSHFPNNSMNIAYPDLEPYNVVYRSMIASNKMLSGERVKAKVRPYLQAFTASWLQKYQAYGMKQIREQIKGVQDAGLCQWCLFSMNMYCSLD